MAAKKRFFPSPGQVKSRARKIRCAEARKARYAELARSWGIPVCEVPIILYREVLDMIRRSEAESRRKFAEMQRNYRSPYTYY